jgi:hypothetical protein
MNIQLVNVLKKVSLLSAILLVTVVASAQGQTLGSRLKVDIPFDFQIGETKLPSGEYSVGRARQNSDDVVLSVEDHSGRSKALRTSMPVVTDKITENGKLVFHRYGDQYFLYQVWPAGATNGRQFPKSRGEREILQTLAANHSVGKTDPKMPVDTVIITSAR